MRVLVASVSLLIQRTHSKCERRRPGEEGGEKGGEGEGREGEGREGRGRETGDGGEKEKERK